jgi:endoribonuclease L-PSP
MPKTIIHSEKAPAAVGPYSQAISIGGLVFASGQLPIDPLTGTIPAGSIEEQAHNCLKNLRAIAEAAGGGFGRMPSRPRSFLVDMQDFKLVNAVYASYFNPPFPARSTVQVAALPLGADIEIEAVFHIQS